MKYSKGIQGLNGGGKDVKTRSQCNVYREYDESP